MQNKNISYLKFFINEKFFLEICFFFSSQTKNESCGGGLELEREFIKLQFGNVVLKCSCVLHSDNIEIHLLLLVFKLQFSHVVFSTKIILIF